MKHIFILFFICSHFVFAQKTETFTQKIIGESQANGGEFGYEAIIKYYVNAPGLGDIYAKVGLVDFKITWFEYKGKRADSMDAFNFPISISKIQCDFNGRLDIGRLPTQVAVEIVMRGVQQGQLDIKYFEKNDINQIVNYFDLKQNKQNLEKVYLNFKYAQLSVGYLEALSKIATHIDKQQNTVTQENELKQVSEEKIETQKKSVSENKNSTTNNQYKFNTQTKTQSSNSSNANDKFYKSIKQFEQKQKRKMESAQRYEYYTARNLNFIQDQLSRNTQIKVNLSSIQTAKSPEEVLLNLENIKASLDQKIENNNQTFYNTMAYVSSMSSNTKEELHTNIAAAGFMGLKTLADNSKAKKEKKQAERNARTKMLNFKEEIIDAYNNGLNESINTLVNTPNENVEQYAIDLNQYYQCLIKEVNNNFSYKSSSWSTPSSLCKQPVAARVIEKEVTSDDYLKISKRKFKFYGKYNDERFFESAKMYVNKAIESDKKNASAYIYRAIINGNDIIEQYRDVLIAEYLKGKKFNDKSLKKEIENQFNQEYKVAVNVSDIVFLERAATYELYPSDKLYSPIQTAIKLNNATVFAILAKQKTELYSKYKFDYFLQATINNNNNIVDYIIKNEPSEFVKDIKIKDALEIAFFNDNHVIFNLLLDNGASTKYLDQKVLSNEVLKTKYAYYLINAGYTLGKLNLVKKGNEFYEFPEDFYVSTLVNGQKEKESNEITSYFLSKIKNKKIKVNGNSLYHIAIKNDDLSLLNNLALQGFEKNILDDDGFNFISAIAIYGPDEVLNNLSNLNLDLNIKDERGMTLLHYCALANHPNMVYIAEKILETKNVNVNTQNNMGYTPLHYAGKNNDLSMYMTLLNYNADKTIKDNKGQLAKLK